MIEMTIPSVLDPTLAPPGCHVVSFFTQYTPYWLEGGRMWTDEDREKYAKTGKSQFSQNIFRWTHFVPLYKLLLYVCFFCILKFYSYFLSLQCLIVLNVMHLDLRGQ